MLSTKNFKKQSLKIDIISKLAIHSVFMTQQFGWAGGGRWLWGGEADYKFQ